MAEHPIQGLMQTAMENIKEMVDVDTIVGSPVQTPDGSVIMPISKVGFGFVAGGSDIGYGTSNKTQAQAAGNQEGQHTGNNQPFGGGSGGGVSITPIAFLVVGTHGVKVVPLDNQTHLMERIIDSAPRVIDKLQTMFRSERTQNDEHIEDLEDLVHLSDEKGHLI
ncbi:GerW family sporulation protein [Paenibacillus daejeonensis]|uniref:GerW family sporulation protein n=1 Tax=Paenibacillus daejeonensis TaxID=135193 RepID=UPI000381124B|nr:GerW family sporulation protein [Paenibacillus daejeonensis]